MRLRLPENPMKNFALKLIALVMAVLVWGFVSNRDDPVRSMVIQNVPITIVNEDSIGDIGKVAEPAGADTVNLKVTERRSVLNRLSRNDFYVEADLENINQLSTVPLTATCENSRVTWDEIALTPSSLKVIVEDKTEQTFAVSVTTTGEVADGYAVGLTEVAEGKTILIAGPVSLINIINQVTAPVSVAGLSRDSDLRSILHVYDKNGAELTESQLQRLEFKSSSGTVLTERVLTVKVSLWEERTEFPLEIETTGRPGAGYRVSQVTLVPSSTTLIGTKEAFERIGDRLKIADGVAVDGITDNLTTEIDLSSTVEQYEDLKIPAGVDPQISVQVTVEKTGYSTVDIPLSDVILENKPEDMKLVFTPADKISVGVRSGNGDPALPDAGAIKARMDLSSCEKPGNYEIPVTFDLPKGYTVADEVVVKVSASEPDKEADSPAVKK